MYTIKENKIIISASFRLKQVMPLLKTISDILSASSNEITIDLNEVVEIDSAAIASLIRLKNNKRILWIIPAVIEDKISSYIKETAYAINEKPIPGYLEKIAIRQNNFFFQIISFIITAADCFYFSARAIFDSKGRKKGAVYEQITLIGNNAVPIVTMLALLIGLILSLQSAAQLKQFGADIFLVDLIVISMITEMGPMITAIIVAGRSGSAIAAEISTMKITEELDALKVMALNPLKYVVAPKMLAITISLPLLTIAANVVGILGGFIIAVLYLDLNPNIFLERAIQVMDLSMWRNAIVKSILFSWIIVLIAVHFGSNVKGGSEGVGKATTASVVASIFSVIMANALLSIIFYFDF